MLKGMRSTRAILMLVLAAALSTYALDCLAVPTPDAAMQCCESMPCLHHSDDSSQDCCKTMEATHAPFVQQRSVDATQIHVVL